MPKGKRKGIGVSDVHRTAMEKAVGLYNSGNPDMAIEHLLSSGSAWKTDPDAIFTLFLSSDAVGDEKSFEDSVGYARMWLEMSFGKDATKYIPSKVLSTNHPEALFAILASERLLIDEEISPSDLRLVKHALGNEKIRQEAPMAVFHSSTLEFEAGNFTESANLMSRFMAEVGAEAAKTGSAPCSPTAFHRAPMILALSLFASGKTEEAMECVRESVIPFGVGLYKDPPDMEYEYEEEDDEAECGENEFSEGIPLSRTSAGIVVGESGVDVPESVNTGKGSKMFGSSGPVIPVVAENPEAKAFQSVSAVSSGASGPKMFPSVFRLPDGSYVKAY